ncbi:MAG: hypothetical protein M0037_11360 [Betaproteobacteria bacterium]|nr:hypothetical protein [Betaproteobacteria bacterium]
MSDSLVLVLDLPPDFVDADVEHGPVQPGFLPDVLPGRPDGAGRRCGHAVHAQVFQDRRLAFADDA